MDFRHKHIKFQLFINPFVLYPSFDKLFDPLCHLIKLTAEHLQLVPCFYFQNFPFSSGKIQHCRRYLGNRL